ncbi:MAG: DUF2066 domain-containing protein [Pseudomonadota bacterium]
MSYPKCSIGLRWAVCLVLAVVGSASVAAPAGNLFAAEVPISERTQDAQKAAMRQALAVVMVKVSGSRSIARQANAQLILDDAQGFVQQYRYTPNNTLLVAFDGRKLQADMRTAGLPVWGADRPATLVWLAIDRGDGERQLMSAADQGEIRTEIETLAAARGIPLVWPLYDSTDRAQVEVADVWGGFTDNIVEASRRYGTEAVLVARMSQGASGSLYGTWALNLEGEADNWRGNFENSINRLADFYAQRLAVSAADGPATRVPMTISNLTSATAYAEAINTVQKLSAVERIDVVQVMGDRVVLELSLRGDANQVSRALGLSRSLRPDPDSAGTLAYRFGR